MVSEISTATRTEVLGAIRSRYREASKGDKTRMLDEFVALTGCHRKHAAGSRCFERERPQESLWQSEFLITPRKARLMRRSWAQVFRNEAVPLIDEERFAEMYSPDMGRPNRAVQTVPGVLVLKEMFDLTDIEALEELEFNLLWHHALGLEMEEAHLAQKTLHNFRVRLMEHDGGRLAFCETTDRMIGAP